MFNQCLTNFHFNQCLIKWPYSRSSIPIKNNFQDFKFTVLLDFLPSQSQTLCLSSPFFWRDFQNLQKIWVTQSHLASSSLFSQTLV
jgi:hypothetical protein